MFWIAIALFLIAGMVAALWYVRRSIFGWMEEAEHVTGPGFTLAELRQLHQSGKMTADEFERAKQQVILGIKSAAAAKQQKTEKTIDGVMRRPSPPS